jgi:hypothetical protein
MIARSCRIAGASPVRRASAGVPDASPGAAAPGANGRSHEHAQLLDVDRLRQIVERAGLQRRHRVLRAAVGRDDGDRRTRRLRHFAHEVEPRSIRQPHVCQAQRVAPLPEPRARDGNRLGRVHVQPKAQQRQ